MKLFKKHQIKESTKDKAERTDAHKVQEYHKSEERIARMVAEAEQAFKDADERELWG